MQEREKILLGKKEKKRAPTARTVYVSLDRADAIIDGWIFAGDGFAYAELHWAGGADLEEERQTADCLKA